MDFASAVEAAVAKQRKRPDACIMVANVDNADIDCPDGLTEEERDQVDEALRGSWPRIAAHY
jgi:hypothetical protein